PDRLRRLPILVERREHLLQRELAVSARATPELLIGGVDDDPVDPRSEGGVPPEGVDLPDHAPERVLHGLLGILGIACDTDRQPIRAIAVQTNQTLRRRLAPPPQCSQQMTIAIDV